MDAYFVQYPSKSLIFHIPRKRVAKVVGTEPRNSQDSQDNSGNLCGPIMTGDNGAQELAPRGGGGGPGVDLKGKMMLVSLILLHL